MGWSTCCEINPDGNSDDGSNVRITLEDVDRMAALAKLKLTGAEREMFRGQLERILDYMDKLNELDTENVQPTTTVQHTGESLREDRVVGSMPREEALGNAPARSNGFFKVPKILPKS